MKKMKKYIRLILLCILTMLLAGKSAEAKDAGSITIELDEGADSTEKGGVIFAYTKVEDVGNISSAKELNEAALEMEKKVKIPDGTVTTNKNGVAVISGIKEGTYLITAANSGNYDKIMPFLLKIPMWNEESGNMEYDVKVVPKHEPNRKEQAEAPQTNLDGDYKKKIIGAGLCMLGAVFFLVLLQRKGENEEHF